MRLPRERRIRASADFQRLRTTGSRIDCGPFVLNVGPGAVGRPARFAVIAAKKSLPLAVDRNRVKRLARELFRTDPSAFPDGWEVVLVARASMLRRPLAELRRVFAQAADRAVGRSKP
ncbi:MAG: ribonuclease P protein component [Verrucomicrobiota bacterium]